MVEFSLWDIVSNLLLAARWTIVLSLIAFVGGGLVGLALLVARTTPNRSLQQAVAVYVQVFQGTPLLMQLFLAYFGMAMLGVETSAWTAAAVALTLYSSAFLAEIWHGCVKSIGKGQWEAAQSLALNFGEQLRYELARTALGADGGDQAAVGLQQARSEAERARLTATEAEGTALQAQLQAALARPYDEHPDSADLANFPPDWAATISISCSS